MSTLSPWFQDWALGRSILSSAVRLVQVAVFGLMLSACSSDISRFDYPFGFGSSDDEVSPDRPVYGRAGGAGYAPSSQSSYDGSTASTANSYSTTSGGYSGYQQPVSSRAPVAPVTRYAPPQYSPPEPRAREQFQQVAQATTINRQSAYPTPAVNIADANGTVRVRQGDTLFSIARNNNVALSELKRANGLSDNNIRVGQQLIMPGSGVVTSAAPARRSAPASVSRSGGVHRVQSGDTVFSIARRYGVHHSKIIEDNNLKNPNDIKLGQVLNVPGSSQNAGQSGQRRVAALQNQARSVQSRPVTKNAAATKQKVAKRTSSALPKPDARSQGRFRWPVRGRIISTFGPGKNGVHNDGINVAVPSGTSVKAAENGVVAYAGNELKGYGNLVLIRHSDDWVSAYAHNEQLLVKRGDKVKRGQVISKAGRSGSVKQPQVHFELRRGSKPVNPMRYMVAL